jgi:alpha-N-arabinofuranosidase
MGLLEFLEWTEDMHAQPVLAVFAGFTLRGTFVATDDALQPFVQDALDEIEYVTGNASTKWGAVRAKDGHPAPFPLTYVEIGNEDGYDKSGSYEGRFAQFDQAIKAKYPDLQCISTKRPRLNGSQTKLAPSNPDVVDEHFYRSAFAMEDDATHYDKYNRKGPKIFVGEWATTEGTPTTDMNAALGDAAWMTGLERNSDLVVMASYAPLFVNVNPGGMEWKSNLIGYNGLTSYGSPSYYAQKIFNNYLGDSILSISAENVPTQSWQPPTPKAKPNHQPPSVPAPKQVPVLFYTATRGAKTGTIYLKVVNTSGIPQSVHIDVGGVSTIQPKGTLVKLSSANPSDTNSISNPTKIAPITTKLDRLGPSFDHVFAPYSINVLQMETR